MACKQSTLGLDLSVRQAIGALLEACASPAVLARLYRCHPAIVCRNRANLDLYGDVAPPSPSVQGRPRKITYEARECMLDWLSENGEDRQLAYRDEIVVFLQEEYSIYVSKWIVGRALREVKLTIASSRRAGAFPAFERFSRLSTIGFYLKSATARLQEGLFYNTAYFKLSSMLFVWEMANSCPHRNFEGNSNNFEANAKLSQHFCSRQYSHFLIIAVIV
jgi:hypothetical protein